MRVRPNTAWGVGGGRPSKRRKIPEHGQSFIKMLNDIKSIGSSHLRRIIVAKQHIELEHSAQVSSILLRVMLDPNEGTLK